MTFLGQPTGDVAVERHPHIQLVVETFNAPPEMRAPEFVLAGNITQRLERNRDFNGPSVVGHYTFRLKDKIRIEVLVLIRPDTVCLHAERTQVKFIGFATVVKGVEQYADIVVVPNIVAFGNRSAHFVRFVVAVKGYVEKLRIITK